ncbi:MAG: molybdopterin-dependent oxidoreductase [Chitinophagales bacterium]
MANFLSNLFTRSSKLTTDQVIVKKTIVSFFFFFLIAGAAFWGWKWLQKQPADGAFGGGIKQPLRTVLDKNEKVFNNWLSAGHLAKTYPLSAAAKNVRVNGKLGMSDDFDPETWELYVIKAKGDTLTLKLDDIRQLPRTEIIFDFKCIEGWSQVTHWGGVKFSDFMKAYHLTEESAMKYLGMSTPDEEYYVGIDMPSVLHPQTLLCYEMNGKPLPMDQGYPLRLIIPVKYGIKSLKRIGTMYFDNQRPPDYWAERGYDYFSGL